MSPDPLTKTGRGKTSVIVTITGQAIARNENTKIKMGKVLLRIWKRKTVRTKGTHTEVIEYSSTSTTSHFNKFFDWFQPQNQTTVSFRKLLWEKQLFAMWATSTGSSKPTRTRCGSVCSNGQSKRARLGFCKSWVLARQKYSWWCRSIIPSTNYKQLTRCKIQLVLTIVQDSKKNKSWNKNVRTKRLLPTVAKQIIDDCTVSDWFTTSEKQSINIWSTTR